MLTSQKRTDQSNWRSFVLLSNKISTIKNTRCIKMGSNNFIFHHHNLRTRIINSLKKTTFSLDKGGTDVVSLRDKNNANIKDNESPNKLYTQYCHLCRGLLYSTPYER